MFYIVDKNNTKIFLSTIKAQTSPFDSIQLQGLRKELGLYKLSDA